MRHRSKRLIATGFLIHLLLTGGVRSGPAQGEAANTNGPSPRIVNIINFIRQCEPRIEWITEDVLYERV